MFSLSWLLLAGTLDVDVFFFLTYYFGLIAENYLQDNLPCLV